MPNITPLQSNFSVGEVAPDVQMRSSLQARSNGVSTLKNFLTDSRGPVSRRPGFRYLGRVGVAGAFVCSQVELINDSFKQVAASITQLHSSTYDYVVYTTAIDYPTGQYHCVYLIDPDDDIVRNYAVDFSSTGTCTISPVGSVNAPSGFMMGMLNRPATSTERKIERFDFAAPPVYLSGNGGWGGFSTVVRPIAERSNDVLFLEGTTARLINKVIAAPTTLTLPSGFVVDTQTRGVTASLTSVLFMLKKSSDGAYYFVVLDESNGSTIPTPTIQANTSANWTLSQRPIVVGSTAYWPVNYEVGASDTRGYIIKTSLDGTELGLIDCTFGVNQPWNQVAGETRLFYSATNNAIYFLNGSISFGTALYKMDVTTEEITECPVARIPDGDGNDYTGQGYSGFCQPIDSGRFAYVHSPTAAADTVQLFAKVLVREGGL